MKIILYTIDCPKCLILERKLQQKNIEFEVCKDLEFMKSKGFLSAPMLEVEGVEGAMEFGVAVKWVNEQPKVD